MSGPVRMQAESAVHQLFYRALKKSGTYVKCPDLNGTFNTLPDLVLTIPSYSAIFVQMKAEATKTFLAKLFINKQPLPQHCQNKSKKPNHKDLRKSKNSSKKP
jgi:hypothetical protein